MDSIIQTTKECFLCRLLNHQSNKRYLEEHHCIGGNPGRTLAEQYGLKVYLCQAHHHQEGVHGKRSDLKRLLQQIAQEKFEEQYSHEEWMRVFGKNYIEGPTCLQCKKQRYCNESDRLYPCTSFVK